MLDWIKKWFRQRPSPRQRRFSRIGLETLEERQLLSAGLLISPGSDEVFDRAENESAIQGQLASCWLGVGSSTAKTTQELPAQAILSKFLVLDGDQPQDDGNSCGPNSAARVLRYHGFNASYTEVKNLFHKADPLLNGIGLGLPAANLAAIMRQWGYQANAGRASFERVLDLVSAGKPVLAMVRVGTIGLGGQGKPASLAGQLLGKVGTMINQPTWPALHWIAVQGFDRVRGLVYFTDTNGSHHQMSFADFERAFNWDCTSDMAKKMLDVAGVRPGSIVY